MLQRFFHVSLIVTALWVLCACPSKREVQPLPTGLKVSQLKTHEFPAFKDMFDKAPLNQAIDYQIRWLEARDASKTWQLGDHEYSRDHMLASLHSFKKIWAESANQPEQLRLKIAEKFHVYQVAFDGSTDMLITSYHAPIYKGSLKKSADFPHAIYARPKDLITIRPGKFPEKFLKRGDSLRGDKVMARLDPASQEVVPYFSRTQIDKEGALEGRGLELCYLADYMDAFLFHVQGGGFVSLPDGRFLRLNYAGKNGHPYTSIGGVLVKEGILTKENLNLPKVLDYLRARPAELERVCFLNESYVFYQADKEIYDALAPEIFPHGVLDFPVTPKRSIATDKRHFPGGALCYVEGGKALVGDPAEKLGAFALDQDTGGAIVDAHLDFFAGAGPEAENLAGIMNDPTGRLYFLVLKEAIISNN